MNEKQGNMDRGCCKKTEKREKQRNWQPHPTRLDSTRFVGSSNRCRCFFQLSIAHRPRRIDPRGEEMTVIAVALLLNYQQTNEKASSQAGNIHWVDAQSPYLHGGGLLRAGGPTRMAGHRCSCRHQIRVAPFRRHNPSLLPSR